MKKNLIVVAVVAALLAIAALFPEWLARVEYYLGYAVCSQTPDQSLFAGTHQLPMSARCMGFFAGAFLVELGMVLRDDRSVLWPPLPVSLVLLSFVTLWAVDGINTSLADMQAFHLYPSSNPAHLISGLLGGTGTAYLVTPFFNSLVWSETENQTVFGGLSGLSVFLLLDALFAYSALEGGAAPMWAMATFSAIGMLVTFALATTLAVVVLLRKEKTFARWSDLLPFVLISAGIAAMLIAGMYFLKRTGTRVLPPHW